MKYGRKKYSENISVSPTRGEVILGNLWKFTIYHIQVAGFTSNGHGPFSETVDIRTDEDGKETCRSRVVQGRIQLQRVGVGGGDNRWGFRPFRGHGSPINRSIFSLRNGISCILDTFYGNLKATYLVYFMS